MKRLTQGNKQKMRSYVFANVMDNVTSGHRFYDSDSATASPEDNAQGIYHWWEVTVCFRGGRARKMRYAFDAEFNPVRFLPDGSKASNVPHTVQVTKIK